MLSMQLMSPRKAYSSCWLAHTQRLCCQWMLISAWISTKCQTLRICPIALCFSDTGSKRTWTKSGFRWETSSGVSCRTWNECGQGPDDRDWNCCRSECRRQSTTSTCRILRCRCQLNSSHNNSHNSRPNSRQPRTTRPALATPRAGSFHLK